MLGEGGSVKYHGRHDMKRAADLWRYICYLIKYDSQIHWSDWRSGTVFKPPQNMTVSKMREKLYLCRTVKAI